jgi:MFS transporter, DHA2 family, multidrug resistance protein
VLAPRSQFHQARLAEHAIPSSLGYQGTLQQLDQYFAAQGSSKGEASQQATAWIGQTIMQQAAFLAYIDVFWVLAILAALMIPAALMIRSVKLDGGGQPMGVD